MKRIVLCADDYGQAEAISQGIITLIQNGRLSATSCMVNSPLWPAHAKRLLPFQPHIDLGLHFNLTEGKALSARFVEAYGENLFSLSSLMGRSFLRKPDIAAIEAECEAQLERFIEALGCPPNFIDGHQHVHQLPVVRTALVNVYEKHLRPYKTYVRLVGEKPKLGDLMSDLKKVVIYASGTKALKRLLEQNQIPHNNSFAGIYSFSKAYQYKTLFPRFLEKVDDKGIIMCHPGLPSSESGDAIAEARYKEYQYLSGNQFLIDCHRKGVTLGRF